MNHPARTRPDPDEVRARILEVAEQYCRRIGYQKTSVADIASELGMSPANGPLLSRQERDKRIHLQAGHERGC